MKLCAICDRQLCGKSGEQCDDGNCSLCFGLLNSVFVSSTVDRVKREILKNASSSAVDDFVLYLNLPVSLILREHIVMIRAEAGDPIFSGSLRCVPLRKRLVATILSYLANSLGIRPNKQSNFAITLTISNDEFIKNDHDFLLDQFPDQLSAPTKKRRRYVSELTPNIESLLTKCKVNAIASEMTADIARSFPLLIPTEKCSIQVELTFDSVFIAGRYCKYSRNLPQSPWAAEQIEGVSISEIICDIAKVEFNADSCRFIASGREDIDVRMLGTGRPFLVQIVNPRKNANFGDDTNQKLLFVLKDKINSRSAKDIFVSNLQRVNKSQVNILKIGEEEKRKTYTALCYSDVEIEASHLEKLSSKSPIDLSQKTPVRVLKRRPLIERLRTIYEISAFFIDAHHFFLRLTTQAGTYVKEFVHGDFGRTAPSLSDVLEMDSEIDIIELDVDNVDLEWPPK